MFETRFPLRLGLFWLGSSCIRLDPSIIETKLSKRLRCVVRQRQDGAQGRRKEQEEESMSQPDYRETAQNI